MTRVTIETTISRVKNGLNDGAPSPKILAKLSFVFCSVFNILRNSFPRTLVKRWDCSWSFFAALFFFFFPPPKMSFFPFKMTFFPLKKTFFYSAPQVIIPRKKTKRCIYIVACIQSRATSASYPCRVASFSIFGRLKLTRGACGAGDERDACGIASGAKATQQAAETTQQAAPATRATRAIPTQLRAQRKHVLRSSKRCDCSSGFIRLSIFSF